MTTQQLRTWDVIKNCLTIQDSTNAVSVNTFVNTEKMLRMSFITIHVLLSNYF